MKGNPITEIERNYIRNNYMVSDDKTLAKVLNRTKASITIIRQNMRLFRGEDGCHYIQEQVDFVRDNFIEMTDAELGSKIGRSERSVTNMRYRFKFIRPRKSIDGYIKRRLERMQELIKICETTQSPYRLDKAKQELKKLSGL